ncbi:hypothetical protein T07_479 [Trichinella nelsoni]|uniref:Uncharacterized protein n=1 Tax=Trichinella nelsoni TaxID=6336 RepID=A0A0V0S256_9BILA|nr:hypothetical protein T07_479 [Trichinella nelsoni]
MNICNVCGDKDFQAAKINCYELLVMIVSIIQFLIDFRGISVPAVPRILASSIYTRRRCLIILRKCLKAGRDITDRLLI